MHIDVQYLQKRNGPSWRYRRRVPKQLIDRVGKTEIIVPLGRNEREALFAYASAHAYVEGLLATSLTEHSPPSLPAISFLAPIPAASKPETAPSYTLEASRRCYLKDRIGDDRKKQLELKRVFKLLTAIIPSETPIGNLKRNDAREVRDHMLDGRSSATVERYLNVVRAMLNHAIREHDLGSVRNPFVNLQVQRRGKAEPDRNKRKPFTEAQVLVVRQRVLYHANAELKVIWRLLEGTGCRISEITGLRTVDVKLSDAIPHIDVEWHDARQLKTKASQRCVPLIGDALEAASLALRSSKGVMLFPTYGKEGGGSSVSAALGKHVRACVQDRKVTTHSLRHRIKDLTRRADVQKSDQDILLGHSSGSIGEDYGGDEARLVVAKRGLEAAYAEAEKLRSA